jgi:nitrogen fixation/metabolism regulation signal transduction histidine kinase
MKLKTKVLIWISVSHAVFAYLLTELYSNHRTAFFVGEALLVTSLILSSWIYRAIGRPFDIISSGIESLKDKDFSTKLNPVGHGEMDELISVYNLMIDQLRQERLLQMEKSSFLQKLIDASPSGIIILDFEGNISSLNPAAVEILDLSEQDASGRKLDNLPGSLAEELSNLSLNESKVITLSGIKSYKCHKSTFVDKGFNRAFITIEELTREIYIKEKSAYEKVIKMMSHEVNNSIGAINSILNSCLNYKSQLKGDDQEDYQNALNVSINRNQGLSDLMSNFARVVKVPDPVMQSFDIISLLRSVKILMEVVGQKKELEWIWDTDSDVFEVSGDYQQLEQVFINVLKNAIEAVDVCGKIRIKTEITTKTLSISNTGPGIPKEISNQLFTPFFSTKKNGQGIGLMLTREILLNHNYKFSLGTSGEWTEFTIDFYGVIKK